MSSNTITSSLPELEKVSAWMARAVAGAPGFAAASQYSAWSDKTLAAIAAGLDHNKFCQALSAASRYGPKGELSPSHQLVADADDLLKGWNPSRWTALEAVRVGMIVAQAIADSDGVAATLDEAFRFADEGELCALYRSLQFLPKPERFVARSAEGCRTNMKTVFEANGCDTPFPAANFDEVAWRQLCVKSLFAESPLWRVVGFDARVDEDLSRMALDLADERRSAGRSVYPELWMCLGSEESGLEATERKLAAIETELAGGDELSRKGAILALGRLGQSARLEEIQADGGTYFGPVAGWALMGRHDQTSFASISPPEGAEPKTHHHDEGGAVGAPLFSLDPETPSNPT